MLRKHDALFITLTTPSAHHAQLKSGGRNPAFERETIRAAQRWLCKMWARFRSRMKRNGVEYYGFRVAEPHHDGTPHWHAILFFPPEHAGLICTALQETWLSEYSEEPGAERFRVKIVRPDVSKGTPTGYIAKYVAKNIDGAGAVGEQTSDETGRAVIEDVSRVVTWASIHGIRQFQQIGGPAVGLWREARRLSAESDDPTIELVRQAASQGQWCAFTLATLPDGGLSARRTTVRLHFRPLCTTNSYGEPRKPEICGLAAKTAIEITRPVRWRLERARIPPSSSHLDPYQ